MADGSEIEDRVDLDEDNYIEEDDDVEDQIEEEDKEDGASDENIEPEDSNIVNKRKDKMSEEDGTPVALDHVEEDETHHGASISEEEMEKQAELLSLPPHGSEIFIGGMSRDVSEGDLRDLCEPFGELFEVRIVISYDSMTFFLSSQKGINFQGQICRSDW